MMEKLLLTLFVFAAAASAGTICPGGVLPLSFAHDPDSAATGCNTVITINPDLTVITVVTDTIPYDGVDDNLVGVVNNSSITIGSMGLSGSGIFGLDGDGICTFTFTGDGYCSASQRAGTDPQDYFGPTSTFTITNTNTGTVNFAPTIPAGGQAYFSLEEPPTANLQVTIAPEPGSFLLLAFGLCGLLAPSFRKGRCTA